MDENDTVFGVYQGVGRLSSGYSNNESVKYTLEKIVSGGQTGTDRAALDCALACGIAHGGWCPSGRMAADGPIPECYKLIETASSGYRQRTKLNVADSDGTLIVIASAFDMNGGTLQTHRFAQSLKKPHLVIRLDESAEDLPRVVCDWVFAHQIRILNVAGPREEKSPGIYKKTRVVLGSALAILNQRA